ncbi:hypothetical protein BJ165DRAFT_1417909 [Panaeolus papilionaceus]|nr:hypothetical protein BJ165DRAFT_1417909 [Panaeolus papilionaceus]
MLRVLCRKCINSTDDDLISFFQHLHHIIYNTLIDMDSFTTIAPTTEIPTSQEKGSGGGTTYYCVIA